MRPSSAAAVLFAVAVAYSLVLGSENEFVRALRVLLETSAPVFSSTRPSRHWSGNATDATGDSAASTRTPSRRPLLRGHAVVQLAGQLGNHIAIIAYLRSVQLIARSEYGVDLVMHFRRQPHPQAVGARRDSLCLFPSVRAYDLWECNGGTECDATVRRQEERIKSTPEGFDAASLRLPPSNMTLIRETLGHYAEILRDEEKFPGRWGNDATGGIGNNSAALTIPFLGGTPDRRHVSYDVLDAMIDRGLRDFFKFDDACCKAVPYPDEYVFHHRSFQTDLRRRHREWGGMELEPDRVANELLGHLPPGAKVAILSRSKNEEFGQHVAALEARNFSVRAITGQSGVQDFCFLSRATAGTFGLAQSTYAEFAALLAPNLRNATLYRVSSAYHNVSSSGFNWTNPRLARIMHYPIFTA